MLDLCLTVMIIYGVDLLQLSRKTVFPWWNTSHKGWNSRNAGGFPTLRPVNSSSDFGHTCFFKLFLVTIVLPLNFQQKRPDWLRDLQKITVRNYRKDSGPVLPPGSTGGRSSVATSEWLSLKDRSICIKHSLSWWRPNINHQLFTEHL